MVRPLFIKQEVQFADRKFIFSMVEKSDPMKDVHFSNDLSLYKS